MIVGDEPPLMFGPRPRPRLELPPFFDIDPYVPRGVGPVPPTPGSAGVPSTIPGFTIPRIGPRPAGWAGRSGKGAFDERYDEEFLAVLKEFRRNNDTSFPEKFRGGEGQLFPHPNEKIKQALKRWFVNDKKPNQFQESVQDLKDAQQVVEAVPNLAADLRVVKISKQGSDWILREFDIDTIPLNSLKDNAKVTEVRNRAIATLEASKRRDDTSLEILRKLRRYSANIHWDPVQQKLVIIDMR